MRGRYSGFKITFTHDPPHGAKHERRNGVSAAVEPQLAAVDADEIRRSLSMYEGLPGRVSVMYLQEQGARPTYAQYATTAADLDQAAREIVREDLANEPLGIYVRGTTVAQGVAGRGTGDDTVAWISFRADLDMGKPGGPASWPDVFTAFGTANLPTPTYWQHSGNGFYPTWQLAAPVAHGAEAVQLAADIEAELRRAWNAAGFTAGVDSCRDAARVWRLAGSVHRKNRANPITSTIGHVSAEVFTLAELRARVPARVTTSSWDGNRSEPRRATADAFEATYAKSLAAVHERGRAEFRHAFFLAARNAHRMVAIGLRTREQLREDLLGLVRVYWPNAEFNGDDLAHIHDALNNPLDRGDNAGALASPWELLAEHAEVPTPEGGQDGQEPETDSWLPQDLTPYVNGTVERPETSVGAFRKDGLRFFYPGLEHAVIGETEGGKTWFLLASAAAELEAGNRVVYVHFEENDPNSTVRRLLDQFKVPAARLLADFLFIGPERRIPPGKIDELCAERVPSLVVLDGQNEAMALEGQGINDPDGAAEFRRKLVKPWTRHGAAVAAADHVVKDPDRNGSGYALGSVHKLNGLSGAGFLIESREAFGKGLKGNSGVYVVKDRPGQLRAAGKAHPRVARKYHVAEMVIDDSGDEWLFYLYAPQDEAEEGIWAEAAATRKERAFDNEVFAVVAELVGKGLDVSSNMVVSNAHRNASAVRAALDRLEAAGRLVNGAYGKAKRYQLPPVAPTALETLEPSSASEDQQNQCVW